MFGKELEVWPRADVYNFEQPLIQFRAADPGSWQHWFDKINDFLKGRLKGPVMSGPWTLEYGHWSF